MPSLPQLAANSMKSGCSCSQAIVTTFAPSLGLSHDTALKIAAGFGGGMGRMGEVCGAVTGAIIILGLQHGSANPTDPAAKAHTHAQVRAFMEKFQALHGHLRCRDLLNLDLSTPEGLQTAQSQNLFTTRCPLLVESAATLLQELLPSP